MTYQPNEERTVNDKIDDWQPGDPIYRDLPEVLKCECGVEVRWFPDVPATCPECGLEWVYAPERTS